MIGELVNLVELHKINLALGKQVRTANIEIITATTGEIFKLPAGIVIAKIQLEPNIFQTIKKRLIGFARGFGEMAMCLFDKWGRH